MSEPATSTVVVAGAAGFAASGLVAGIDVLAVIGALAGALIFFTTTEELPVWKRVLFLVVSFVMGYLFAPAMADVELFGVRPFKYAGPAAFGASVVVVTVALAVIKRRGAMAEPQGRQDG
ncbi:putative holin [Pseudomonas sp. GW531-T4]|uniref:putative holin n=1 Tax=Pseudomonas sp. GW531-T4 TaxID=2075553 RepID=UPI000CD13860|nr:putative holin [Pseudomonas sp. GW531-T4]POA75365.1 hypothetical protein C1888_00235 [Pseudomonas sp. GW531-T4]